MFGGQKITLTDYILKQVSTGSQNFEPLSGYIWCRKAADLEIKYATEHFSERRTCNISHDMAFEITDNRQVAKLANEKNEKQERISYKSYR